MPNFQLNLPKNISKYQMLLIGLCLIYFVKVYVVGPGDFRAYYHAGTKMREGLSPYFFYIESQGWVSMFSYPPSFALFMVIFTILPLSIAGFLWNILSLCALFRVYILVSHYMNIKEHLTPKQYRYFVFFTLLFLTRFILYNFDLTQSSHIILWGTLEGLRLIQQRKSFSGSFLLASMISIKLLPLVFIPYLIYRTYFKEAFLTILCIVVLNLLPLPIYGIEGFGNIFNEWWRVVNPTNVEFTTQQNFVDETVHGLSAFVYAFFSDSIVRYDMRRHFFALSPANVNLVLAFLRLFFITLTLYFLKLPPFKREVSRFQFAWEVSYLFMVIPLLFPQQMKYAFVLQLPAISYLIFYLMQIPNGFQKNKRIILLTFFWLLTTFTTDGIIGRPLYEITQYLKLITWGSFLLMIILMMTPPSKFDEIYRHSTK